MTDEDAVRAGDEVVVWADTAGRAGVTTRTNGESEHDGDGTVRLEIRAQCLRVVRRPDDPDLSARRLQRLRDPHTLSRAAHRHRDGVLIVGRDDGGRCGVVERKFATVDDAAAWLDGRRGLYWIVETGLGWWMPRPERVDPFCAISATSRALTAWDGRRVFGLFDRLDLAAVEWVFCNGPHAFFVVAILQLLAVLPGTDGEAPPAASDRDVKNGDHLVLVRLADGTSRCVLVTPDEDAARAFAATCPSPVLVARRVDQVDTH